MIVPDKVQIGASQDFLDGVSVDTPAGNGLFRETVVLADPSLGGGLANVRPLSETLNGAEFGVVTHSLIQGRTTGGGGSFVDVKVTPSGALTVEAEVAGTVSIAGTVNIAEPVTVETVLPSAGNNTSVNASTSQVTLLPQLSTRKGATIYNDSIANPLRISLGATASMSSFTLIIASGGYYEVPFGYTGIVTGVFASTDGAARMTVLT